MICLIGWIRFTDWCVYVMKNDYNEKNKILYCICLHVYGDGIPYVSRKCIRRHCL